MRLPPAGPKRDLVLALLMALVAAVCRLPRLGTPGEEIFDEVYHAKSALQLIQHVNPIDWVHPPTSKLLIGIGIRWFGYEPWAWRLMPALAGMALAFVFYLLARRALQSERAAILASALLLCDGVYLVQSRVAMTNIFAVLFQLTAALLALVAFSREKLRLPDLLGFGLALGLALSTRWTSLWCAGFLGLLFLVMRGRRLVSPLEWLLGALAFVVAPALVYTLAYVPFMQIKHPEWPLALASLRPFFAELIQEQKNVWGYHATLTADHPYYSAWYTWPWLYRPTWYHYKVVDKLARGVIALGNPGLWWAAVPATLWALGASLKPEHRRFVAAGWGLCALLAVALGWISITLGWSALAPKLILSFGVLATVVACLLGRAWPAAFAASGFLLLYLPWGLSPRTLNFAHYLFEALPYACLSLGLLLDKYWESRFDWVARGYLVAVVGLFLFFYPILAAVPIPTSIPLTTWTWFRSWV